MCRKSQAVSSTQKVLSQEREGGGPFPEFKKEGGARKSRQYSRDLQNLVEEGKESPSLLKLVQGGEKLSAKAGGIEYVGRLKKKIHGASFASNEPSICRTSLSTGIPRTRKKKLWFIIIPTGVGDRQGRGGGSKIGTATGKRKKSVPVLYQKHTNHGGGKRGGGKNGHGRTEGLC